MATWGSKSEEEDFVTLDAPTDTNVEVILSNPKNCILLTKLLNAGQPQGDDFGDDGALEKVVDDGGDTEESTNPILSGHVTPNW